MVTKVRGQHETTEVSIQRSSAACHGTPHSAYHSPDIIYGGAPLTPALSFIMIVPLYGPL
jgi:hypothetical protein